MHPFNHGGIFPSFAQSLSFFYDTNTSLWVCCKHAKRFFILKRSDKSCLFFLGVYISQKTKVETSLLEKQSSLQNSSLVTFVSIHVSVPLVWIACHLLWTGAKTVVGWLGWSTVSTRLGGNFGKWVVEFSVDRLHEFFGFLKSFLHHSCCVEEVWKWVFPLVDALSAESAQKWETSTSWGKRGDWFPCNTTLKYLSGWNWAMCILLLQNEFSEPWGWILNSRQEFMRHQHCLLYSCSITTIM